VRVALDNADQADTPAADADAAQAQQDNLAQDWGAALQEQGAVPEGSGGEMAAQWASMVGGPDGSEAGSDRLLSQNEIDGLLGFSTAEKALANHSGIRAIADSSRVSHERLPMLEIVFDRMVRLLASSLRNFFSDNVEVTMQEVTSVRFGDYVNSIPLPTLLGVFRAEEWENLGLVTVEPDLIYAALDILLGGKRGVSAMKLDGRPFTTIEIHLVKRLIETVLGDAELAFRPLSPVTFQVDRIETNPRFAMISRPANAAILVELRFDMEERGGKMQILLPYATIEPIRDLLLQSFMGEKLGRDPIWEGHLATEIWQSRVGVEAVLHETRMPLGRIARLEVGDTLTFDKRADSLVTLKCGDVVLTEGRVGRLDDRVAVQVARPLRRSRTTLAAFEASAKSHKP
jgi:flagellar motor switch protein FliM